MTLCALPRTRGGISGTLLILGGQEASSPHTRGYFLEYPADWNASLLFPAHAGVFPPFDGLVRGFLTLPRTRGGISIFLPLSTFLEVSSPHTRGYFRGLWVKGKLDLLFPAHAGVFPRYFAATQNPHTLPRTRGGISNHRPRKNAPTGSSPHTRGYFLEHLTAAQKMLLFPAHAGVFPAYSSASSLTLSLPRTRGGISFRLARKLCEIDSSPHTRGYFLHCSYAHLPHSLFPAHAGVFP